MRRALAALGALLALAAPAAPAGAEVPELAAFRDRLEPGRVYSLVFEQRSFSSLMEAEQVSSGAVRLARAGSVRWDYRSPSRHHLIVTGETMLLVVPEDRMAYVGRPGAVLNMRSPLRFLTGASDPESEFAVERLPQEDGVVVLRLSPRTAREDLRDLKVWMAPGGVLRKVVMADGAGNLTSLSFGPLQAVEPEPGWDRPEVPTGYTCADFAGLTVPCPTCPPAALAPASPAGSPSSPPAALAPAGEAAPP